MNVYGVFLRPDPISAMAISNITFHVERQFGLVSAGAFPPHITLAGSVPIAAEPDFVASALDTALRKVEQFPVYNSGIIRRSAIVYDTHHLPDGRENLPLKELAAAAYQALAPHEGSLEARLVAPFDAERFRAHMSLASHELAERPETSNTIEAFIRAIPVEAPRMFTAEWVTLYQFWADDWAGPWWESLRWKEVTAWRLLPPAHVGEPIV